MFCLEKLQDKLSDFLDLDKNTLPKIQDILIENGYLGLIKGEEVVYFKDIRQDEKSFIDKKGNEKILSKEIQQKWLDTFNLKSIDEAYIPKHNKEIKEALGDKEIKLTKGSLLKLIERDRTQYIEQLKQTLDEPDLVLKDIDNMLILAKKIKNKEYFTSINLETNDYFISVSNAPKKENILKNKVDNGANILYVNPQASSQFIYTDKLLQTPQSSANTIDNINSTIFPTNWNTLSAKEKIAFLKEKQKIKKELEEKRIQDEFIKRSKEQTEKIAKMNEQKEKQLDKSIIDKELELQSDIDSIKLKETSINTEDDSYKAYFVKVKLDNLKPNFTNTNTQGRTEKKEYTINKIAQEPNLEKFFNSEGSFEGLPIITKDGQIIAGNHRAEALKKLNKENKDKFNKYAKEKFGIDLKDDEIVVRMVDEISNEDILKLSFTSNIGRETNIAELAISTLAKYKDKINKLPNFIESISVEELKSKVAKALDKESNGLDSFNANLALLASLARNKNISFVDSIKAIKGSAEDKERVLKMYVDNAGSIYNVSKNKNTPNIDLREYLTQSVYFTAKTNKSRAENYRELIGDIESVLKTTNNNGTNELINLNPNFYNELISKILGYSFARFKSLENPSRNLYEFLSTSQSELLRINEPTLFNPIGKSLKELDIYDFLSLSVQSGEVSKEASDLIDLLPKLKEKHKVFKDFVAKNDTTNQNLSFKKELEEAWFKEFGLKSIDEDFIPKIPQEIQDKLAFEVKIKASDLEKIVEKGREKYIDKIKPTFETPDYVFRDMQGDILFAKSLDDKLFFVNVTREYDNEILSVTNSPKKTNNIKNKLEKAKEIFYISPELRDSSAHKASTGVLSSTSRDGDAKMLLSEPNSNPTTKDLIKQAKEQGLSAKETKKLIQENKHQQAEQNF